MTKIKMSLLLGSLLTATALAGTAPKHDLLLCAAINKNYVIGSKIVTQNGIFQRGSDGSFQHIGLNFPSILNLSADPRDPRVFYLATLNGCVFTKDGGQTWRIGTSWDMTEPKDVCVDPNAPDNIYLALPDGIAVSPDRGATWPRRENGLPNRGKYTQTIEVDRTTAGRVLAGCESGIYLTEDGAQSWHRLLPTKAAVDDIEQSPLDPQLWLTVTQSDGAHLSHDGGRTWQKIPGVPADEALYNVAFDATNPQRWAIASWHYGVLTTEDGGHTWTARNAGLPADGHVFKLGIDPDTGRLYVSVYQNAIHVSDDFGRTWRAAGLEGSSVYNFVFVPKTAK